MLVLAAAVSACAPSLTVRYVTRPPVNLGVSGLDVAQPQGPSDIASALRKSLDDKRFSANEATALLSHCNDAPSCFANMGEIRTLVLRYAPNMTNPKSASAELDVQVEVIRRDGRTSFARSYNARTSNVTADSATGVANLMRQVSDSIADQVFHDIAPRTNYESIVFDDDTMFKPGISQAVNGNLVGATNFFEDMLRQNNQIAGAYYNLGVIAEANADYPKAKQLYESAKSISAKSLYDDTYRDFLRRQAMTQ